MLKIDANKEWGQLDFNEKLELLNSLFNPQNGWKAIESRKEHMDDWGDTVAQGETYYARYAGSINPTKLSRRSIEKMMDALFDHNPWLERMARQEQEARCDQGREAFRQHVIHPSSIRR